ncbi:hypothetical protein F5Y10DRAFT_294505 [Nemania abortiva]|nr:hypothetical protein F5Y10DRAFT_294505 [Nemania abortiva]
MVTPLPLLLQDEPRHLTLNAARTQWNKVKAPKSIFQKPDAKHEEEEPKPTPDFARLHSLYAPGSATESSAPINTVAVTQIVKSNGKLGEESPENLVLKSEQQFMVEVPQFTLPEGYVHSVYPAQGMSVGVSILPHIILNDPHLPWERPVVLQNGEADPSCNGVPWLAVLCFTADELLLAPDELAGTTPKSIFSKRVDQTSTFSLKLQVGDILGLDATRKVRHCVSSDADRNITAEFIFMAPKVFNNYFSLPPINGASAPQMRPDTTMFKYLAHSRAGNIDSTANPSTESADVSVVVASRTGPWNITSPTQIFVHLVSLERVETIAPWPTPDGGHIALCSLYSWTYQCLPPGSRDIGDVLHNLSDEKSVLGPSRQVYEPLLKPEKSTQEKAIGQRLKDGYTMTKYRTQTGEETAAFFRGPLVPNIIPHPLNSALKQQSTFSTDLRILDKSLGMMDVSYSSAWQLGRTLGLEDRAFCFSLGRLRTAIHNEASTAVKDPSSRGAHDQKRDIGESLHKSLGVLQSLTGDADLSTPSTRWNRNASGDGIKDASLSADEVHRKFPNIIDEAALNMAQSCDGEGFYNEINTPKSADWAVVLKWVLDRMFLFGIPAHYLIADPSYLPKESLRLFFIDQNWIDALIDGALSLANYTDQDNDVVRNAIKKAIVAYLDTVDPVLGYKPQRPTFGFFLRSDVVSQFPDLKIDAPFASSSPKAPILRQENIDSSTLLVLLDRLPESPELGKVTLTLSSHQQHFVAASHVGPDPNPKEGEVVKNQNLKDNMGNVKFDDKAANASMVALQLSDSAHQVAIGFITEVGDSWVFRRRAEYSDSWSDDIELETVFCAGGSPSEGHRSGGDESNREYLQY